jgi:meiotically up-regulated gene 157 (Mug157) protein
LARLFTNSFPNTLDTTIQSTACLAIAENCNPLSYIITGDINAMWIRDSANQILPYIDYIKHDGNLKRLFLGAIYMQAHFLNIDPFANAFNQPRDINMLSQKMRSPIHREETLDKRAVFLMEGGKVSLLLLNLLRGH